jgi:hypothetical protein
MTAPTIIIEQGSAVPDRPRLDQSNRGPDAETIYEGQRAWIRLREGHAWADWIAVGRAHLIGRAEAMRAAHATAPAGPRYKNAFGDWLKRFGFHTLDKGDRARLFDVIEHLVEIDKWRSTLPPSDQLKLNHPSTVLRQWRRSCRAPTEKLSPMAKLKQQFDDVVEENRRLKREVESGGGDHWAKTDRPADIAKVMADKLSLHKLEQTAREMLALVKERRGASR